MKGARALTFLVLLSAGFAQLAFGQSLSIPMDAGGRPLRDDRGNRLEYQTAPIPSALLAAPAAGPSSKASRPRTQKGRAPIFQSTGVSPSYGEVWRTASFGTGIGGTGIWPVDADDDGDNDFVLSGGSGFSGGAFWSIVTYNNTRHEYEIAWQSPRYTEASITALGVIEEGSSKHVWVGRSDGRIDVFNASTRTLVGSLDLGGASATDFAVADGDNDGTIDVVVASGAQLVLYDPITLNLRRTIAASGSRIAIANVDDDSRLEIVLDSGTVLDVDGDTVATQWSTTSFGARIGLADIDADGKAELIAAEDWYTIRAWDLDAQSLKWSLNAELDIAAMRLADVTGDAVPELVYGDGQWGEIHVIDTATCTVTCTELWSIPNPEHGVTDIAVFDADGDGTQEILWGAGWTSTGPDHLYVHDVGTHAREWQSDDFSGPYEAVDIGDVDADGEAEIVVASIERESGYGGGIVMVLDAATHALEWRSDPNTFGSAVTGLHAVKLANTDTDSQLEIIVGTDQLYDGALYVIDGLTHERQNDAIYDSGSPLSVLDAADLAADGRPEVIAGNEVAHTGSPGVFIYVLDPVTGAEVWKSAAVATGFSAITGILAADVGAAGIDLLAASSAIHAVRWSDKRLLTSATAGYLSVAAGDVDDDAGAEILAGRDDGVVAVLDGETLSLITTYDVCTSAISALQMQAANRIIATCGDTLIVYDLSTRSVVDLTQAGTGSLGLNGSLVTGVVNDRPVVLTGGSEAVEFIDLSSNRIPTLSPLAATVHWRGVADLQIAATDADGDPLRFEFVSLPTLGAAIWTDMDRGTLRYSAGGMRTGQDSVQVRVSDGAQYSLPQTLDITLSNEAPRAQTQAMSFHWRGAQNSNLVANDADADPFTFNLATAPQHGSVGIDTDGTVTYTPSGAYLGTDSLSYTVTDGADVTTETVQITLTNTAPIAAAGSFDLSPAIAVDSRFDARDEDGDPLTYSIVQQPTQGTLTIESDTGLFRYTPKSTGNGTDTVTFSVSDGVSQTQGSVSFKYPTASPSAPSKGGGGGNFGLLLLILLAPPVLARDSQCTGASARSFRSVPRTSRLPLTR